MFASGSGLPLPRLAAPAQQAWYYMPPHAQQQHGSFSSFLLPMPATNARGVKRSGHGDPITTATSSISTVTAGTIQLPGSNCFTSPGGSDGAWTTDEDSVTRTVKYRRLANDPGEGGDIYRVGELVWIVVCTTANPLVSQAANVMLWPAYLEGQADGVWTCVLFTGADAAEPATNRKLPCLQSQLVPFLMLTFPPPALPVTSYDPRYMASLPPQFSSDVLKWHHAALDEVQEREASWRVVDPLSQAQTSFKHLLWGSEVIQASDVVLIQAAARRPTSANRGNGTPAPRYSVEGGRRGYRAKRLLVTELTVQQKRSRGGKTGTPVVKLTGDVLTGRRPRNDVEVERVVGRVRRIEQGDVHPLVSNLTVSVPHLYTRVRPLGVWTPKSEADREYFRNLRQAHCSTTDITDVVAEGKEEGEQQPDAPLTPPLQPTTSAAGEPGALSMLSQAPEMLEAAQILCEMMVSPKGEGKEEEGEEVA